MLLLITTSLATFAGKEEVPIYWNTIRETLFPRSYKLSLLAKVYNNIKKGLKRIKPVIRRSIFFMVTIWQHLREKRQIGHRISVCNEVAGLNQNY